MMAVDILLTRTWSIAVLEAVRKRRGLLAVVPRLRCPIFELEKLSLKRTRTTTAYQFRDSVPAGGFWVGVADNPIQLNILPW